MDVATTADTQIVELANRLGAMSAKLLAIHDDIGITPTLEMYDNQAVKRARAVTGVMSGEVTRVAQELDALNRYMDVHPHVF
jgi:hypothetical protein